MKFSLVKMNGCLLKSRIFLFFSVMFFTPLLLQSCTKVESEKDALEAIINDGEAGRAMGIKYLLHLDAERREKLGLQFILAPEPNIGYAGIRLLASIEPEKRVWDEIENNTGNPAILRRYAVLSSMKGRKDSIIPIVTAIENTSEAVLPSLLSALKHLTDGLDFGDYSTPLPLLSNRWMRHIHRRQKKKAPHCMEEALCACYNAPTEFRGINALKRIRPEFLGIFSGDILDLAQNVYVSIGREAALMLEQDSSDAGAQLLFELMDSSDYLTRYNAFNSLTRRAGIRFDFDPSAPEADRKLKIEKARKLLGCRK